MLKSQILRKLSKGRRKHESARAETNRLQRAEMNMYRRHNGGLPDDHPVAIIGDECEEEEEEEVDHELGRYSKKT